MKTKTIPICQHYTEHFYKLFYVMYKTALEHRNDPHCICEIMTSGP